MRPAAALLRWLPAVLLAAGFAAFWLLQGERWISWEALRDNRAALQDLVRQHAFAAGLGFWAAYAATVALSLPVASLLTLAGGFLFGTAAGAALAATAGTAGACLLFLAARTALGARLRARVGERLSRFDRRFDENAFGLLLAMRLLPLLPFWLVNLAPAFTPVRLPAYAAATLLGVIPGALVLAAAGSGLGAVLDAGAAPDLGLLTRPEIILPLVGLAALSLAPVAYRLWRQGRERSGRV